MPHYPIHPACALWPRPSDEEVKAIADSIKAEGLHNPIWLYQGSIIDGKTRYEACETAGVEPRFEIYTGNDPVAFTIAQNAKRRHLSAYDLAGLIVKLCDQPRGGNHGNQYTGGKVSTVTLPIKRAAEMAGTSHQSIIDRKTLDSQAEPNIIHMVRNQQVGMRVAAQYVQKTPRTKQRNATVEEIRKENSVSSNKKREQMITIPRGDVVDKFLPLIKRVKEQSKRHTGTVSLTELGFIAHELKQLADSWTKGGSEIERNSKPAPSIAFTKGG